jgi:hypothetical protein
MSGVTKVQVSDTTGDAIKHNSRYHNNNIKALQGVDLSTFAAN